MIDTLEKERESAPTLPVSCSHTVWKRRSSISCVGLQPSGPYMEGLKRTANLSRRNNQGLQTCVPVDRYNVFPFFA